MVVIYFGGGDELGVGCGCEERVGEIAEEVFEESGDGGNVVMEGGGVAEVNLGGV